MKSVSVLALLLGILLPWKGDAGPVVVSQFPTIHQFATYLNANAYLHRAPNMDVYRYVRSAADPLAGLPFYSRFIKLRDRQNVVASPPSIVPISSHQVLPESKVVIRNKEVGGLKLVLSPPPFLPQRELLGLPRLAISGSKVPTIRFNPSDHFNRPVTFQRFTFSKSADTKPVSVDIIKSSDGGPPSERLSMPPSQPVPQKTTSDNPFPPEIDFTNGRDRDHEPIKEELPSSVDSTNVPSNDGGPLSINIPISNSPSSPVEDFSEREESNKPKLPEPEFDFTSSSDSTADNDKPREELNKQPELDFTIPAPSNSSSGLPDDFNKPNPEFESDSFSPSKPIDEFNADPDFDFTLPSNSSDNAKLEDDFNRPHSGEKDTADADLLDILEKVAKADDKHRLEDSLRENNNKRPEIETPPQMQSRQDSGFEQPAPFFPPIQERPEIQQQPFQPPFQQQQPNRFTPSQPAPQPQQPGGPSPSSFFPSPPQYQTSDFFSGNGRFSPNQQQQPGNHQGQQPSPQLSGLPAPPQFQTSEFFTGNNGAPNQQSGSQDQPPQQPQFSGLPFPSPPQFQTDSFFPKSNRFGLPSEGNGQQSQQQQQQQQPNQQPPQFPPFNPSGFPRNFGGPSAPPGPEPENGYNPNFMFEMFPEPPYQSEFAGIPEDDFPEQSGRSAGRTDEAGAGQESSPPTLDFNQSTLRGVKTEEILDVVQRKPVPPDCVYNTVSYGLNGEDCVQRKKK